MRYKTKYEYKINKHIEQLLITKTTYYADNRLRIRTYQSIPYFLQPF